MSASTAFNLLSPIFALCCVYGRGSRLEAVLAVLAVPPQPALPVAIPIETENDLGPVFHSLFHFLNNFLRVLFDLK